MREVRAALVARHRVDLVDDDRLDGAQRVAALLAGDQQVERLGGGDHEARRLAHHRAALRAGGVAGAHRHAHLGRIEAELGGDARDLGQRPFEVLGDVDGQRLQRRHVDDARHAVDLLAALVRAVEAVDAHEEGGERLARTGGRGDERVAPGGDVRPRLLLRARWGPRGSGAGTTLRPPGASQPAPDAPVDRQAGGGAAPRSWSHSRGWV